MKNSKRVITFLTVMSVIGMNVPNVLNGSSGIVAFADEASQNSLAIIKQPANYNGPLGTTAIFSVEASGEGLTYQWQVNNNGTWKNTTMEGSQTSELKVEILQNRNGNKYRCIIKSANNEEVKSKTATLSVGEHTLELAITAQPESYTGPVGSTATFSVGAVGNNLSYQWQVNNQGYWKNTTMQGCQTSTLTVDVFENRNGYKYRCIVKDSNGREVTSKDATLTVGENVTPLEITKQPEGYLGPTGNVAIFSVQAKGTGLSYQWQVNNTGTWKATKMDGSQTPSLKVETISARDGYKYRCIVKDSTGAEVISDVVTLSIGEVLSITAQPTDFWGNFGDNAIFSVVANGTDLTYQWQVNSKGTWKNTSMTGNTTPELNVEFLESRVNYKYRCIVTDKFGTQVISNEVGFKEGIQLSITNQPVDYLGTIGDIATFKVEAIGSDLTYQWQVKSTGAWKNTSMSGNDTSELSAEFLVGRINYKYRCIVTDKFGTQEITNEVCFKEAAKFEITKQPMNYYGSFCDVATFSVSAKGTELSYQWQVNTSGTWKNTSMAGNDTSELSVDFLENRINYKYRCIITDKYGRQMISDAVGFKQGTQLSITKQPENYIGPIGTTATFTVEASGEGLTYQWQVNNNGTWKNTTLDGNQTSELHVEILQGRNGNKYRCIVSSSNNEEVKSSAATLSVGEHTLELAIFAQPESYNGPVGSTATFSVGAVGNNLSYQWQVYNSNQHYWKNTTMQGCQTSTLYVDVLESRNGFKYRCIVKDSNGEEVTSKAATLTVGENVTSLEIIKQPESYLGPTGKVAIFTVQAKGTGLSYQWQVNNTGTWKATKMDGGQTPSLMVETTSVRDGYKYRCIVKDSTGAEVISNVVTLSIGEELSIAEQPTDFTGVIGNVATFKVEVTGTDVKYQWQVKSTGDWKNSGLSGNTTATLSVEVLTNRDGNKYRCIVTDKNGNTITSNAATLTIAPNLTLTSPSSTTITSSDSASFTISSNSTISTYLWETSKDGGETWDSWSENSASFTISGEVAQDGMLVRCTVTDTYGQTATSEPATLTIEAGTQNVTVNLWDTYSVYNTASNPVEYTFTADGAGYYYFNTTAHVTGTYENEDNELGVFYAVDIFSNEEEYRYFYSMIGDSNKDAFYLDDNQTITFTFNQEQLSTTDYFDFAIETVKPDWAAGNGIITREATPTADYWCAFTAPAAGTYKFYADSTDEDGEAKPYYFMLGTTEWTEEMEAEDGYVMLEHEMTEGETVYVRIRNYEEDTENTSFKFGVAAAVTEEMLTGTIEPEGVTEGVEAEPVSYDINSKTAYFKLNAAEASTYFLDIANIDQTEPITITFIDSNGFEIVPDDFIELECGSTDEDGVFYVEFDPFVFGDSEYIYVKFETSDNNIGSVNISYTYDADENIEEGDGTGEGGSEDQIIDE